MLNPALNFFSRIGFSTPAIDLGPARHAGFHTVPREIAINHDFIKVACCTCLGGVGPGPDQRQLAFQHIDQLWQFIEAGPANEATHRSNPWIALGDE